jgi:acyl-CoA thioesterase
VSNNSLNVTLRDAAAVEPLAADRFGVDISSLYSVMGHPNGGYLQCVLSSAALAAASAQGAPHLHTTSITTNYVGSPEPAPAEIFTDVRRVGRGASFVHVTMMQGGVVTTESLVTLGTLKEDSVLRYQDAQIPDVAPLEECHRVPGTDDVKTFNAVDLRLDPRSVGWWFGEVADRAELLGWIRLGDDGMRWDPWSILFASDAFPPATFPIGSSGWVPTLQLTSYARRIPQGEWLRARQWGVVIADGLVDERCEMFDERGQLVGSSSQLAMVRFPAPEK